MLQKDQERHPSSRIPTEEDVGLPILGILSGSQGFFGGFRVFP